MVSKSAALNMSLESGLVIRAVLNNPLGSISLVHSVLPLHDIAITVFPMAFVIQRMFILDSVLEFVPRIGEVIFGGHIHDGKTGNQGNDLESTET